MMDKKLVLALLRGKQLLISLHQFGNAGAFTGAGSSTFGKAVSVHYGAVIGLMGFAQLRRHGQVIVQVGKAAVGVERTRVQNRLCGLFDFGFLRFGGGGPGEVVVNSRRIAVITFQSTTDNTHILDGSRLIICQSNADADELECWYPGAEINPLGDWTGGTNVDTGATNRKLGSDMAFYCCTNLTTVILRNASQVCALGDINVFDSTALAQVFVPAAMVDAYKADSRWSKHASKILAIEDYPDITGG